VKKKEQKKNQARKKKREYFQLVDALGYDIGVVGWQHHRGYAFVTQSWLRTPLAGVETEDKMCQISVKKRIVHIFGVHVVQRPGSSLLVFLFFYFLFIFLFSVCWGCT
jgi:hypothetical protein